jgi:hypothetical protein
MRDQITTPREFFERIVVPDIEEMQADPSDIRRAVHATFSVNALGDWCVRAPRASYASFRHLCAECPVLEEIRELAHNTKHYPPNAERNTKLRFSHTAEAVAACADLQAGWGHYSDRVVAKPEEGAVVDVYELVMQAFEFWRKRLRP